MNLSKSTVSLALAGKYGPSEETIAKIMLYAHEHNYDFSKIRKNKLRTSSKIAILAYKDAFGQHFWSKVYMGIEQSMSENLCKAEIIIYDIPDFDDVIEDLRQKKFLGVVSVDYNNPYEDKDLLEGLNMPVVVIDPRKFVGGLYNQIFPSNFHSGAQCAEYFIRRGHRKLAFFGDISYGFGLKERYLGFLQGAEKYGLGREVVSITEKGEEECEYICCRKRFEEVFSRQDHPTALMCANDVIAYYAYDFLKKMGKRIPQDVSVIAFDNREKSEYVMPKLSSYNVDCLGMGKKAIEIILHQRDEPEANKEIVQLYSRLVERESVCDGPYARAK